MRVVLTTFLIMMGSVAAFSQVRQPSTASGPYVVKSKQQVAEIEKMLAAKPGNTNEDVVAAAGEQTRVAIFHDSKRENDLNEVHDGSDDIYYVLKGNATLVLGGSLLQPNEISPGEWRAKTAVGGNSVTIKKGDLIFVPRGTRHQRTVTGKGFSMILIKIFASKQPAK
ncbi:MAG: cupin domain-containing protein [Acidobacteria bacterium]|nr:cupin domain-containing protein [Acidobacteriota bacterium]